VVNSAVWSTMCGDLPGPQDAINGVPAGVFNCQCTPSGSLGIICRVAGSAIVAGSRERHRQSGCMREAVNRLARWVLGLFSGVVPAR